MVEKQQHPKKLISFEHEGTEILNPFISECGRAAVSPEYYGFKEWHSGGGCMVLRRDMPDGTYLLLSDCDGGIPDTGGGEALIGHYAADGEQIDIHRVPTDGEIEAILAGGSEENAAIEAVRSEQI